MSSLDFCKSCARQNLKEDWNDNNSLHNVKKDPLLDFHLPIQIVELVLEVAKKFQNWYP